jgi:L-ascorbate metabolism protein UlaG (beta-lactamase superfamily)
MYSLSQEEVGLLITWYGTAGFRVETGGRVLLIDPYLSRNAEARPALSFGPERVTEGDEIFLSHGHFDHAADVPQIVRQTGAQVYCSVEAAEALRHRGVADAQLVVARDGDGFDFGVYRARCFHSAHVRFDLPLVVRTLLRVAPSILARPRLLSSSRDWPACQVLSWRLTLAVESDRVVDHFGSAGCTDDELSRLTKLGQPDVLLFPLQGHSRICEIAAHAVARLRPRVVIPHHHDDFYPPLSQQVDIAPFVRAMGELSPPVEVVELPVGEPLVL